jgi:hypothetical protein
LGRSAYGLACRRLVDEPHARGIRETRVLGPFRCVDLIGEDNWVA